MPTAAAHSTLSFISFYTNGLYLNWFPLEAYAINRGCIRLVYRTFVRYTYGRGVAPMVFCRQCKREVEDCRHCVYPIQARRVEVFDEKIETIAYAEDKRILEVAFKTGQVWQL